MKSFEDTRCANDSWIYEILLGIGCASFSQSLRRVIQFSAELTDVEVKGACNVNNGIEAGSLGHLVKSIGLCDVGYNDNLQLAILDFVGECVADLLGLVL